MSTPVLLTVATGAEPGSPTSVMLFAVLALALVGTCIAVFVRCLRQRPRASRSEGRSSAAASGSGGFSGWGTFHGGSGGDSGGCYSGGGGGGGGGCD